MGRGQAIFAQDGERHQFTIEKVKVKLTANAALMAHILSETTRDNLFNIC